MIDDIILFSTADWDNPFWTNKQHVAVELARRGHRVFYVDSVGLRRPSATAQDIRRIFKRLRAGIRPPRRVQENIWVWSPLVLPFQGFSWARILNRYFLSAWILFWLRVLGIKRRILWTYHPLTTELLLVRFFDKIIYHCVDEIKEQPGMPRQVLEMAECRLGKAADIIFVTTPALFKTRKLWNSNTYYFPNVADYNHFSKAMSSETSIPEDISAIPAPRIGFIGAISGYKVDFELVRKLANTKPDCSIVLIGKVGEGDPWTDIKMLKGVPNIYLLGPRPYSELPGYLKALDLAIMPYKLNGYTECMFPMKFFEYLSSGRPIVSVNLPTLKEFSDVVYLADSYSDFVRGVELALKGKVSPIEKRLYVAKQYTYQARTEKMMQLIFANDI